MAVTLFSCICQLDNPAVFTALAGIVSTLLPSAMLQLSRRGSKFMLPITAYLIYGTLIPPPNTFTSTTNSLFTLSVPSTPVIAYINQNAQRIFPPFAHAHYPNCHEHSPRTPLGSSKLTAWTLFSSENYPRTTLGRS